ncbi:MAG TPA: 2-oxoacid:ferredoxin oxidoreductase subunit beta [Bacteroidetes bacterium]|nr:2-oxoacid:ferredoxin oxidoreductase subunit beta [Bacteroidota bacterium]
MTDSNIPVYTFKDFVSDQEVRWCPGCDDYVVLRSLQKALPLMGRKKEDFVFVSGIGCSSRFPYYVDTYGIHGIHGRAAALATGIKLANHNLSVWIATGDGDSLAIGGNHFIHLIRRNIDVNLVLFNNEIYGLTKGQFSPTSLIGQKTKSSPFGNIQPPFHPGELTIGSGAKFFARVAGGDTKLQQKIYVEAEKFEGAAIIEVLQNCVIFNDGAYDKYTDKQVKSDAQLVLEHGKPMIFGKEGNKGIVLDGLKLKVVTIGEDGVTEDDILVHDALDPDPTLHLMLARMEMPIAVGVIRAVPGKTVDELCNLRIEETRKRSQYKSVNDLFASGETYEVK